MIPITALLETELLVFPARAGMIPPYPGEEASQWGIPRESGDDPL